MAVHSVLIANRGEIAIRVARAAADLGIRSVAVYSQDDAASRHRTFADEAIALPGRGPRAYLDAAAIIAAAVESGCDALHPGYGFLSENAQFGRLCADNGLVFVGPAPETLELFGDKSRARSLAAERAVPLIDGVPGGASLADLEAFRATLGPDGALMIKAVAGGGGRGMRKVEPGDDLAAAYDVCRQEAAAAFGEGALYAERLVARARHVEVQIIGDGKRAVALGDRDCSIQRRNQKLIEIAPAPALEPAIRQALAEAAIKLAESARLKSLCTFEFLLDADDGRSFWFIEANPRLQVEHTITEAVSGLDLVQLQFRIAGGEDLTSLGLADKAATSNGCAVQLRVNLETMGPDGSLIGAAGGVLRRYEPAGGPGVRIDDCAYAGYETSPAFDSLIAKVVVFTGSADLRTAVSRARRAAGEFRVEGVESNLAQLMAILERPEVAEGRATTNFVELHAAELAARARSLAASRPAEVEPVGLKALSRSEQEAPTGAVAAEAPLRATVVSYDVCEGDLVHAGQTVAVLEAMKMQHLIAAPAAGEVCRIDAEVGLTVEQGQALLFIAPSDHPQTAIEVESIELDHIRPDLAEVIARHALTLDENRPDAVARRRRTAQRTARENLADLFDPGSFTEFGALAVAAQRRRRPIEDLRVDTPADGVVVGVGAVNGELFDATRARCVGLAYDFTVLAGTQGYFNHKKTDRILEFAEESRAPIIWYTEGGGGRPGDVDGEDVIASWLDTPTFTTFARLSGSAPRIAINSGRCFAGNAVFFGCSDITIATRRSNIGLGGPAMIEGGGLGVFSPDDIGPSDVQYANGTLDLLVEDEAAATAAAKQILGVFQGPLPSWNCADQRLLRHIIPENRVRSYDVRQVIRTLADTGTWLEMRAGYGAGMITGFLRIEGRALGLIANNPHHLGGAIDSEAAEKGAHFLQLCDAFDVPVLSLCDTPGFMVGPQSDATASVRRGSRLFVTAASLTVPFFAVVLRKAYGLGSQAMAGGDFASPAISVSWPTGEFGPMGVEGAVRLGFRKELEAETNPASRQALFEKLVARMYEAGKAMPVASAVEIDAVIDPADTRRWILQGLNACPIPPRPAGKKRPFVDVW